MGPSVSDSQSTHGSKKNRLLKQSDIKEGGSNTAFMVLNELNGELTYYESNGKSVASSVTDASAADLSLSSSSSSGKLPHWEGEDWKPATAGREAQIHGLDLTGQSQASSSTPRRSSTACTRRCTRPKAALRLR